MTHTPSFKQFFGRALTVSGVALLCFSSPAHAGFEWRGPLEPPVRQAAPAPVQNDMSGLAPVTAWDGTPSAPAPAAPAAPVAAVDAEPVSPALAPFTPATTAPAAAAAPTDVVAGFGRDLPLVIALQQVAPAGHQFSFAPGVNPGVMVSWEGGKPWQQVMGDMLAPQGLGYQLQGNVVVVGFFNTDAAVLPPGAADGMSVMPSDDAAAPAAAPTSLTAAPAEQSAPMDAPAAAEAAPAEAAAASHGEPVTIRRNRPAGESRTAGTQAESVSVMAAPSGKEPVMSYPPETAGTRPVAVTSLPPAATQSPVSEAPADLAVPPPMEAMSPAPETATATEAAAPAQAEAPAAEAAPAAAVAAPTSLVAPAEQSTAAPQKAGAPWAGAKGATLRDTLKSWSDAASVELFWSIDYDYKLKNDISYAGSYDEAVGKLLDQFASVRPQPYGQLHKGKDGPSVLVVKSYDLTP